MTPQTGYAITNIDALKAITASDRVDGYSRLVKKASDGKPAWYTFINENIETEDGALVVAPNDNPNSGRWLRTNVEIIPSENDIETRWTTINTLNTNFYSANSGEKILVKNYSGQAVQIQLPNTRIQGDSIQFISTNSGVEVNLLLNSAGYVGQFYWTGLKFSSGYKIRSLIYDSEVGWIPSEDTDFTPYSSGSGYA